MDHSTVRISDYLFPVWLDCENVSMIRISLTVIEIILDERHRRIGLRDAWGATTD